MCLGEAQPQSVGAYAGQGGCGEIYTMRISFLAISFLAVQVISICVYITNCLHFFTKFLTL